MPPPHPGHPILHFLNTLSDDGKQRLTNSFAGAEGLRDVLVAAGLVPRETVAPGAGQMVAVLALREAAYAVLSAVAAGRKPDREEALMLETVIKSALQDSSLGFQSGGLSMLPGPLGGIHDRLVLSLFDLMRRDDLGRLRECAKCTHLFLDHGRGAGRRWCSMARCGNRSKALNFRMRKQASTG